MYEMAEEDWKSAQTKGEERSQGSAGAHIERQAHGVLVRAFLAGSLKNTPFASSGPEQQDPDSPPVGQGSWQRMLVSQPPVRSLGYYYYWYTIRCSCGEKQYRGYDGLVHDRVTLHHDMTAGDAQRMISANCTRRSGARGMVVEVEESLIRNAVNGSLEGEEGVVSIQAFRPQRKPDGPPLFASTEP
ncbi:uncharacterized protein MYCFIDRAFT_180604 [Pseudocercospora fijiensis CIRAD86]|uniref:Uncharacterized protein n=1 Tax=Pseudocercospora fijiensis (strain CIRAD86) TaxID=383855 RepID=M2YGM0_PSEFD|nr:uncharacterized protein MYCFIDRAFT_180604 [Pseudocercospora fijiensis CIRAD86]EME76955.1 hypothetical protein MYCFIDRAFT_180604 [Pseudocercospora fijiensis CIRAD86]